MLSMDVNMPVTLVVKAPNQKFGDLTVECALGWTIRKLKEHLSTVYPNKPKQDHQKLIYSGRLLHDHLTLKDVLRKYDESQTTHTVHLVCSQSADGGLSDVNGITHSNDGSPGSTPATIPRSNNTDGVRHRHRRQDSSETPVTTGAPPVYPAAPQETFQQFYGGLDANVAAGGFYPGMMPAAMMAYSPEQMQWMQQMYAQQMAQFMHLYQGGYPNTQAPAQPPDAGAPAEENVALNRAANPRAAADGPIRMNAQGGPVMDDDEDDANRDWLDWVYTLCRFMVLVSIVYFYSTLSRFVLVFGFFFVVYLYQAGYLRLNGGQEEQRIRRQQQEQQRQEQNVDAQQPEQEENAEDDSSSSGEEVSSEAETAQPTEPPPPPQPGTLAIAWSFFITFFSSLIPQQPAGVNAN